MAWAVVWEMVDRTVLSLKDAEVPSSIKTICRDFRVSRRVVRKVIRSQATEFRYERSR